MILNRHGFLGSLAIAAVVSFTALNFWKTFCQCHTGVETSRP
ncbi:hypothetical protein [Dendronalium phyllosphericum]|nr:hypothetical protein [Dendronalium phyllosphericum]